MFQQKQPTKMYDTYQCNNDIKPEIKNEPDFVVKTEEIYIPETQLKEEKPEVPELKPDPLKIENAPEQNDLKAKHERKYSCPHCPMYKTTRKNILSMHIVSKHTSIEEIKWIECPNCPYKAKTRDHLKTHEIHHHPTKWFECAQCPFKTKTRDSLRNHVTVRHKEDDEIEWFACEQCSYKGKCKHHLKHHLMTKHTVSFEVWKCEECEYSTKAKRNLKIHMKSKHGGEEDVKWFDCGQCSFKTKRKYYLKLHMMSKHPGL